MRFIQGTREPGSLIRSLFFLLWLITGFWFFSQGARASDVILVIRPDKPNTYAHATFEYALEGLQDSLGDEVLTFSFFLTQKTESSELRIFHDVVNPKLVVLMDNKSVRLYRQYQLDFPERAPFTPAVILMSLFVEPQVEIVENSVAIEYQIQGITSLVNFRSLVDAPIDRVGVIFRDETEAFFQNQREACKKEEIELVGVKVDSKKGKIKSGDIRAALKKLLGKDKVEALWMLNDSLMINRELLQSAWSPLVEKYKVPVVVGIERFVTEDEMIGHFAVVPDPYAMGDQAAGIILAIKARKWQIPNERVSLPIGVYKLLNKKKLSSELVARLNNKGLMEVDRIIQ